MAQRVQIIMEDDLDGSPAVETVTFSLDNVAYEIDVNAEHAEQLRAALEPWVGAARRVGGRRATAKKKSRGSGTAAVRAWAQENGYEVGPRGRVPQEIHEAYRAAH